MRSLLKLTREAQWLIDPLALTGMYFCLDRLLHGALRLGEPSYEKRIITAEAFQHLASSKLVWGLWLAVAVVTAVLVACGGSTVRSRLQSIFGRWSDFRDGNRLRLLVMISGFVLVWYLSTIPPNHYFGQIYIVDRLVLIAALLLAVWRPVAVLPLIALIIPFVGQMDHPLGGYSWAPHLLPRQVLLMAGSLVVVRVFLPRVETRSFVVVLCCLVAANYFWSGVDKLELNWLVRDHISNLVPATYANGWLAQLQEDQIEQLASWLAVAEWPLKLFTIGVEAGAIGFFFYRTTPRLVLIGWLILHVGIFATTGICFWMWVVVDIALLALFFLVPRPELAIDRKTKLLSVLLIASSTLWAKPTALAWLDSPVSYSFRIEVVDDQDRTTYLAPLFFAPNEYEITLGDLGALVDEPLLAISWGAIRDEEILERLEAASSLEEIWQIENEHGSVKSDSSRVDEIDRFFRRFVENYNRNLDLHWWRKVAAPPILWTMGRSPSYNKGTEIARMRIAHVTSLYRNGDYSVVRFTPVKEYEFRAD